MALDRLLIADDHPMVLQALSIAVLSVIDGIAIDTASSVAEAEALIARGRYRMVLLDLLLPDAQGFSGLLRLQHKLGPVPIVIVTAHRRPELVEAARTLGAAGFLSKTQSLDGLAGAIRRIFAGERIFPTPAGGSDGGVGEARDRLATLSRAQLRVLFALGDGRLNKQIAGDLDVTEATVKAHLTAIFRKFGVANRTQALLLMQPLLGRENEEMQ